MMTCKSLQTYIQPQCSVLQLEQQSSCCIVNGSLMTLEAIESLSVEEYDFDFTETLY